MRMSDSLRIIFAGTPHFAMHYLSLLSLSKHKIIGVFTKPDCPCGRGNQLTFSPVKVLAKKMKLPVFQPKSLCSKEHQKLIKDLNADVMVVVAYGLLFPAPILDIPYFGCINVHASLLPRWRGAAPIQRALLAGDKQTGITIIQMDAGLDTGDMINKAVCCIEEKETSASLYKKLIAIGLEGLLRTLQDFANNTVKREAQNNSKATYAEKIRKEEAKLNWNLPASQLDRCIRAFNPWPVSYFIMDGQPVKVWKANVLAGIDFEEPGTILRADKNGIQIATINGILNITKLQPSGKKLMSVDDFLNSRYSLVRPGKRL